MTQATTTEYVLNTEHEPDCDRKDDRSALFLRREIAQAIDAQFETDDGDEYIYSDGNWEFEEDLKPLQLRCTGCWGSRYVATDKVGIVVAMTPDRCPRMSRLWGHWEHNTPCEYCRWSK